MLLCPYIKGNNKKKIRSEFIPVSIIFIFKRFLLQNKLSIRHCQDSKVIMGMYLKKADHLSAYISEGIKKKKTIRFELF